MEKNEYSCRFLRDFINAGYVAADSPTWEFKDLAHDVSGRIIRISDEEMEILTRVGVYDVFIIQGCDPDDQGEYPTYAIELATGEVKSKRDIFYLLLKYLPPKESWNMYLDVAYVQDCSKQYVRFEDLSFGQRMHIDKRTKGEIPWRS